MAVAFETLTGKLIERVRRSGRIDGPLLVLSGSMVAQGLPDAGTIILVGTGRLTAGNSTRFGYRCLRSEGPASAIRYHLTAVSIESSFLARKSDPVPR